MARRESEPPRIYVDADVYLDLLLKRTEPHSETHQPRWESAKAVFDAIADGRARLAASALIEAEVACQGQVRAGDRTIKQMLGELFQAPATMWTDVDRFLVRDAIKRSERWGLRGADATHLAAAVRLGCDYLMSHDGGFPFGHSVDGVSIVKPRPVWAATLLELVAEEDSA